MRRVFVTGASSKIGLEVCSIFLKNNWSVLAQYQNNHKELFKLRDSFPGLIEFIKLDFSESENFLNEINKLKIEGCDAFVGGAAIMEPALYEDLTPLNLQRHFNVNVIANILITQILIDPMLKKKWGRIIYLGSIGTKYGGGSNSFAYSLTKHALELFPSCAKKWAEKNVLLNTVQVGVTETDMHKKNLSKNLDERVSLIPMKRMAKPSEIASFIYFLSSDQNTYINLQKLAISGGE
jgi:NAD(P)-dependent dehydrogenase (short-subunit alcohol dehydrogenase family)